MKRQPVPKNNLECYAGIVLSLSQVYGVKDIPEIYSCVEMLFDAIHKYRAAEENGIANLDSEEVAARKRLFVIFLQKFKDTYGIEYPTKLGDTDAKMASLIYEKVKLFGVTVEDYMNWFFDDFLQDNDKIKVMQFKSLASDYFLNAFAVYVHDSGLDKVRLAEQKKTMELNAVLTRIRKLKRMCGEHDSETIAKLSKAVTLLKENKVTIQQLDNALDRLEKSLNERNMAEEAKNG